MFHHHLIFGSTKYDHGDVNRKRIHLLSDGFLELFVATTILVYNEEQLFLK